MLDKAITKSGSGSILRKYKSSKQAADLQRAV